MAQLNTIDAKLESYIFVDSKESDGAKKAKHQDTSPKAPCLSHGPSKTPFLDRGLQKPQAQDIFHALSAGLNELADEKKCTKCAVEALSTLLTDHVRNLRAAKQNGEWTKEERKVLKAETKGLLKPVKKQIKSLWKGN